MGRGYDTGIPFMTEDLPRHLFAHWPAVSLCINCLHRKRKKKFKLFWWGLRAALISGLRETDLEGSLLNAFLKWNLFVSPIHTANKGYGFKVSVSVQFLNIKWINTDSPFGRMQQFNSGLLGQLHFYCTQNISFIFVLDFNCKALRKLGFMTPRNSQQYQICLLMAASWFMSSTESARENRRNFISCIKQNVFLTV